jgi:hypothetical protein
MEAAHVEAAALGSSHVLRAGIVDAAGPDLQVADVEIDFLPAVDPAP